MKLVKWPKDASGMPAGELLISVPPKPEAWLIDAQGLYLIVPGEAIKNAAEQLRLTCKMERSKNLMPCASISIAQAVPLSGRVARILIQEFGLEDQPLDDQQ